MRRSHTISLSIQCAYDRAYGYLSRPVNFDAWAAIEPGTFHRLPNGDWAGDTAFGLRHFRFTPPNPFGVLDHAIFPPEGRVGFNPMRVMPNDDGVDLTFVYRAREGMEAAQFASAIEWITTDLLTLKSILETP